MISSVRQDIRDWLAEVMDIEVIFANQDGPVPPRPYATVLVGSIVNPVTDHLSHPDDEEEYTQTGVRQFTVSVQVFADDAVDVLEELRSYIPTPEAINDLEGIETVCYNTSDVEDLTALSGTQYRTRASIDLFFRITVVKDRTLEDGVMSEVDITSSYE